LPQQYATLTLAVSSWNSMLPPKDGLLVARALQ
jgi:hypothetical protein